MPDMICAAAKFDSGYSATAKPVECGAGNLDVVPCVECSHASQIAGLGSFLHRSRPNDIIDIGGFKAVPLLQGFHDCGRKMLRMHVGQGTFALLADATRRANGIDDVGLGHI